MRRLSQRLLCVCLSGSVLLLQVLRTAAQDWDEGGGELIYEYGGTPPPDFDSNTTIDFTFFSNVSNIYDELHKIFYGTEDVTEATEEGEFEEKDAGWETESGASGMFPPSILLGFSLMAPWLGQNL